MNPTDLNQRAKAVFMSALEKESPELRNQYLDEACANEPELRREVLELLASLKQSDSFMENKPGAALEQTAMHVAASMRVGEMIGPYKLLEEIGEGGMGTVWIAQQSEPIKRKVAIKLIKAGMDSKAVLARFGAERQALAMMDHPNIARVLDGGMTDQGRPFFAMEYVKGVPLTEYCDHAKLSVRERLELFLPICNAVQHAHQKGIIHRDLKPSNILVCLYDGKPVPKVIDFGLAKAIHQSLTDQSLYTAHGMMLGTPLYMSPEQAEHNNLDIDTRTDIYSLGVILYELLTGTTPLEKAQFKQAAAAEMLRLIREVEPPKPSTRLSGSASLPNVAAQRSIDPRHLTRSITGDLDWVVMKSLEKERSRRYETANGLAADVLRHLSGEPVTAAPPSASYRVKKFVRRNRVVVTAVSAVAAALLIGVVAFAWQAKVARDQRDIAVAAQMAEAEQRKQADAARADALAQKTRAEEQEAEAIKQAEEAKTQAAIAEAVTKFQTEMLTAADPFKVQGDNVTVVQAMEAAVKALDDGSLRDQPLVEAEVRNAIGMTLLGLARYNEAESNLRRTLEIGREALPADHPNIATSLHNLAWLLQFQNRFDEAEPLHRESLEIRRASLPAGHPKIAVSLSTFAGLLQAQTKYDEAEPLQREALQILRAALPAGHINIATVLHNLAELLRIQNRLTEAEPLHREALQIYRQTLPAGHPNISTSLSNLSWLLFSQKRFAEAEPLSRESLEIARAALPAGHPDTAGSLDNLAQILRAQNKLAEAEPLCREALQIYRATLPAGHPVIAQCLNNLASLYWSQRKLDQSVPMFEEALAAQESTLGRQHQTTLVTIANLGVNYKDADRLSEAIPLLEEAYRGMKRNPSTGWVAAALLDASIKSADPEMPESISRVTTLMQEMLATARARLPDDSPELAGRLAIFSQELLGLKAWNEAEPFIREALAIREKSMPEDWKTFNTRSMLGGVLLGQNKLADAGSLLLAGYRGMKVREASIPPQGKIRLVEALERLVQFYQDTDSSDDAAKWQAELDTIRAVSETATEEKNTEATVPESPSTSDQPVQLVVNQDSGSKPQTANPNPEEIVLEMPGVPDWLKDHDFKQDKFTFVRIRYSSADARRAMWSTDYPEADLNFAKQLGSVTKLDVSQPSRVLELTDAAIREYPFVYIAEPGQMQLADAEVTALREYLLGGGFLMMDDFWGEQEFENARSELKKVFPDWEIRDLELTHPLFHCVFDLKEKPQVPSVHSFLQGRAFERFDADEAHYRAILDDNGRMMVILCHNTDLADGWERAGFDDKYRREMSIARAFPMGINIVFYALEKNTGE